MSTIYKAKAYEPFPVKAVALKVATPSLTLMPHDALREGRILKECQHERVIPLLSSFYHQHKLILVFPFLRHDLENLLRTNKLTSKQTTLTFNGLFGALQYIHSLGIIHRDVKPSNILLESLDGPVYLADFGIAWSPTQAEGEKRQHKLTDVGTGCYRPPELLFGDTAYDCSLDIWAAGCVVAEMTKKGHYPVLDSGDLGSELALIKSMFTTLGTPTDETWPVSPQ